jgi:dienelactone hydrolase
MWHSRIACFVLSCCLIAPLHAAIVGKTVAYEANGTRLIGYLAYDDSLNEHRPGVLVVHEWWGLNDYAKSRARQLAELGYAALAIDMYGDGKQADHPDQAGAFAKEVTERWSDAKARFLAALDLLRRQPVTDPKRVAAIGYCFGGGIVLDMAREGADLKGVVSFHGTLANPPAKARPGVVKARVLVLTGAEDPFVPQEDVKNFKKEMEEARVDYRVIEYPGAKHSFTNPDADRLGQEFKLPLAYDAAADKASWQEMRDFFDRIFGKRKL